VSSGVRPSFPRQFPGPGAASVGAVPFRVAALACLALTLLSAPPLRADAKGERWMQLTADGLAAQRGGQLARAEKLLVKALAVAETFDRRDPRLPTSLANLATVYHAQHRDQRAEQLLLRSVELREKSLGLGHPALATALSQLGDLYASQGRHREAIAAFDRALSIDRTSLGPRHPYVAMDLAKLAGVRRSMGNRREAEILYRESLSVMEESLGPRHPSTVSTRGQYLDLLGRVERPAEGQAPMREAGSKQQARRP
jgi:tetratricopeptide (TPR) repeat protein